MSDKNSRTNFPTKDTDPTVKVQSPDSTHNISASTHECANETSGFVPSGNAEGIGALSMASSAGVSSQGTLPLDEVSVNFANVNNFDQNNYSYTNAALDLADEPNLTRSELFQLSMNPSLNPDPHHDTNQFCCLHLNEYVSSETNTSIKPCLHCGTVTPKTSLNMIRPHSNEHNCVNNNQQMSMEDEETEEITWNDFDIRSHKFNGRKLMRRLGTRARKQAKHFSFKEQMYTCLPLFDKLRNYDLKNDLVMDIMAGITISILHVPQGIAYSLLIGIPPVFGLYTSFFPVLIYALLGTSSHISIGTMSVLDMMLSQTVRKYHNMNLDDYVYPNGTMKANLSFVEKPSELYSYELGCSEIELLATLCLLVGLFQVVMGVFQMGAISIILSDQLVSAFSCGAAFHVLVSQIPSVLEISIPTKRDGAFSLFMNLADIVQYAPYTKMAALILSITVFLVVNIYKELLDRKIRKYIPVQLPIDLLVIIIATVSSNYMHLADDYSITVMGKIPTGLPLPAMPRMDILTNDVLQDAFVLAMVSYAASLSLSKIYAKKNHYTIRANQEFFALGVANLGSSFFSCFPATASLSRASVMGEMSKTQISSLISCTILLQILLFLAPILTALPKCVVAVIIICAQKSLLAQCLEFPKAWKLSRYEGMIWMVTFLSVICFGIDYGLMAGAIFSVFTIVMRFYHPKLRLLGQIPYTEIYLDIRQHRAAKEVPSVKVIQFTSPLFFINKDMFQESVLKRTLKNQVFKGAPEGLDYGPVRTLIIDCSAMSFIDSSGVEAIVEIANELQQRKIQVCLAALSPPVISMLTRIHFFEQSPYTLIFPSVHEAVIKSDSPLIARKIPK